MGPSPAGVCAQNGAQILSGPARADGYIDAIGRSAAWMGTETGELEAWIWPWKLCHAFNLAVRTGEVGSEIDLAGLARTVSIRPWGVEIAYVHSRFGIRQTIFAHAVEPVLVMQLEIDSSTDLTLIPSFIPDLEPMWPAGMGGQYAYYDQAVPGYVLSESRRNVNAVLACPEAARGSSAPAHQLAGASAFEIEVGRERAAAGPVVMIMTGGREPRETTLDRARRTGERAGELLAEREAAWRALPSAGRLDMPVPVLAEAYRWAVSSVTDGLQYSPGLGTGLVAGFGPTGNGYRPGFSWYFGGDTSINSLGLVAAGQGWVLAEAFPFLESFQRDDGKMMHELTRSAPLLDWFGDYPYAFIHGDTTPFHIVAVANYWRWTGDDGLLRTSWPNLLQAYEFGLWADEDGDGLMDNSRAGLGASELGSLREGLKTGIFIATVWTRALADLAEMAAAVGETDRVPEFETAHERARARLAELFIDPDTRTLNFGVAVSGEPKNDVTAWAAFPMVFGLLEGEAAANTLDLIASARLTTDWGIRMLAEDSPFYDPVGYNNGAVWPFLTGYAALAEYRAGRRHAGYQHLLQLAANTFIDARGRHPEVMSGDYFTALETSVPHQLFSSSPIPAVLIRGLLGLDLDLPGNRLTLAPQLPGGWRSFAIHDYPLGNGAQIDLDVTAGPDEYRLTLRAPDGLTVRFAPRPLPRERLRGTGIAEGTVQGGELVLGVEKRRPGFALILDSECRAPLEEAIARITSRQGQAPDDLRVIRVEEIAADRVRLVLEGRAGTAYCLPFTGEVEEVDPATSLPVRIGSVGENVAGIGSGQHLPAPGTGLFFTVGSTAGTAVGVDGYRRFAIVLRCR